MPLRIYINQNCLNFYRLETDKQLKTRLAKFFYRGKMVLTCNTCAILQVKCTYRSKVFCLPDSWSLRIKVLLPPGTSVSGCHAQKQEPASRHMASGTTDETPCSLGVSNISFFVFFKAISAVYVMLFSSILIPRYSYIFWREKPYEVVHE